MPPASSPPRRPAASAGSLLLVSALLAAVPQRASGVVPFQASNITVFHVNPLSQLLDGGAPINMDTADAPGDVFFELLVSYLLPLACPRGFIPGDPWCGNPEASAPDLVVTQLTMAVSTPFGEYAKCNVCTGGTDHYGHHCPDNTYFCYGNRYANFSVGYENIRASFASSAHWDQCHDKSSAVTCVRAKLGFKMTEELPGAWYSSQRESMCAAPEPGKCNFPPQSVQMDLDASDPVLTRLNTSSPEECCSLCGAASAPGQPGVSLPNNCTTWSYRPSFYANLSLPNCHLSSFLPLDVRPAAPDEFGSGWGCAWNTVAVEKIVNHSCQAAWFLGGVENSSTVADQACFVSCGGVPGVSRNTSSPCWTDCFYRAVLGANATVPDGGPLGGIPLPHLVELWKEPLRPDFAACPDVRDAYRLGSGRDSLLAPYRGART